MIRYISSLRVLATFAVVAIHTSAGILDFDTTLSESGNLLSFIAFKSIFGFAVPLFIMISGALLLNPAKKVGYTEVLRKYIPRVLWALLVFGLPMCLIESFMTERKEGIPYVIYNGLVNLLTGRNWTHMWYLYMLLSLYLITPVLKSFIALATRRDIQICLLFLFVVGFVLPLLNDFVLEVRSYMLFPSYLFMYVSGYYIFTYYNPSPYKMLIYVSGGVILCIILLIIRGKLLYDMNIKTGYKDPLLVLTSALLLMLFKQKNISSSLCDKLSKYCFCIYLVHPVFINVLYKGLHFNISQYFDGWWCIPVFSVLFFCLSLVTAWLLYKIPFFRNKVL